MFSSRLGKFQVWNLCESIGKEIKFTFSQSFEAVFTQMFILHMNVRTEKRFACLLGSRGGQPFFIFSNTTCDNILFLWMEMNSVELSVKKQKKAKKVSRIKDHLPSTNWQSTIGYQISDKIITKNNQWATQCELHIMHA